jgi:hypothetical protein
MEATAEFYKCLTLEQLENATVHFDLCRIVVEVHPCGLQFEKHGWANICLK